MRLGIELVPSTCWFSNVRSQVSKKDWDVLRKRVYEQANYKCEICGEQGNSHPVECHEIWNYDDKNHVQTLAGLIALCPNCHRVHHFGLWYKKGFGQSLISHLMRINEWDVNQCGNHIGHSFKVWEERSKHEWKLNIDLLEDYNIKIADINQTRVL